MVQRTHPRAFAPLAALLFSIVAAAPSPSQEGSRLISFDKYHTYGEIVTYLQAITTRHSDLAGLVEIGRSRMGRSIYAVEINAPTTGPAEDKPAFYIDGNIHGGEVLGGEAALYLIDLFLSRYADDPEMRRFVDTRALYIVPIVNPDGRVISVSTPENHRWNVRPLDQDGDGKVDEDPPEDLDGDGRILRMRIREPNGDWKISLEDPRLMVRRRRGEQGGTYYRVHSEGIDNDGDGVFNEDQIGGIDLNRNFPVNWTATQYASGPYPLSEPETHALVDYITARPNIAAIHTFHTSGGMILRFPTLADQDWDFPEADLRDYDAIGATGAEITGYRNYANDKKTIVDLMNPGHGVFNDWASKEFGVLAITTEMWKGSRGRGQMEWNDQVLGGMGYIDWYEFQHPELGTVELGGWDRWSTSNPPERLIEAELERNAAWVITFGERLPQVSIQSLSASSAPRGEFQVEAVVANTGWMATATAHAFQVLKTAKPVRVRLDLDGAELVEGEAEVDLGVLPGTRPDAPAPGRHLAWRVRVLDPGRPAHLEVTVTSEKAGTVRKRIALSRGR